MGLHFRSHLSLRRRSHRRLRALATAPPRRDSRRAHAAAVAAILVAVAVIAGAVPAPQFQLISLKDEIQIGKQTQQEVRKQVPELTDREVRTYVAGIGRRLAARARGPKYPYSFSVANYREINAFALPGGPVWIHRGAISAAANEAQLAGVLAHEIAHLSQRHAADQISKNLVANGFIGLLGAMLGNTGGAHTAQAGARLLAGGYLLKFSRDDEREADRAGASLMRRAGWDGREMIAFLETIGKEQGSAPASIDVFLSSHPAPAERARHLRGTLPGGGTRDTARFRQIKARLGKLPRAKSMRR